MPTKKQLPMNCLRLANELGFTRKIIDKAMAHLGIVYPLLTYRCGFISEEDVVRIKQWLKENPPRKMRKAHPMKKRPAPKWVEVRIRYEEEPEKMVQALALVKKARHLRNPRLILKLQTEDGGTKDVQWLPTHRAYAFEQIPNGCPAFVTEDFKIFFHHGSREADVNGVKRWRYYKEEWWQKIEQAEEY